jgi:hypothetical protein
MFYDNDTNLQEVEKWVMGHCDVLKDYSKL